MSIRDVSFWICADADPPSWSRCSRISSPLLVYSKRLIRWQSSSGCPRRFAPSASPQFACTFGNTASRTFLSRCTSFYRRRWPSMFAVSRSRCTSVSAETRTMWRCCWWSPPCCPAGCPSRLAGRCRSCSSIYYQRIKRRDWEENRGSADVFRHKRRV